MKVYGNKLPDKAATGAGKLGKPDQASEKAAVEKVAPVDKVALSGRAKEMASMVNSINQMPEIRTEKVEAIGQSLKEGTYKIDPEKIASRMIDEMI